MVQLINTAFAVYEMHAQSGRAREAQRIRSVVENQLAPFTATMPKAVLVGAHVNTTPLLTLPGVAMLVLISERTYSMSNYSHHLKTLFVGLGHTQT